MSSIGAGEESCWAKGSRADGGGRGIKCGEVHCKGESSQGKGMDLSKGFGEPWKLPLLGPKSFKPYSWLEQRVG